METGWGGRLQCYGPRGSALVSHGDIKKGLALLRTTQQWHTHNHKPTSISALTWYMSALFYLFNKVNTYLGAVGYGWASYGSHIIMFLEVDGPDVSIANRSTWDRSNLFVQVDKSV